MDKSSMPAMYGATFEKATSITPEWRRWAEEQGLIPVKKKPKLKKIRTRQEHGPANEWNWRKSKR